MLYTLHFFSSKCSLFHNANLFGSCIIHVLYTGCAEIKKNNSGAKGLKTGLPKGLRHDCSSTSEDQTTVIVQSIRHFVAPVRLQHKKRDTHCENNSSKAMCMYTRE